MLPSQSCFIRATLFSSLSISDLSFGFRLVFLVIVVSGHKQLVSSDLDHFLGCQNFDELGR